MMSGSCRYAGCAVDDTGSCALERDPVKCGNRIVGLEEGLRERKQEPTTGPNQSDGLSAPVLDEPSRRFALPSSGVLGLEDLNEVMRGRYLSVVGILGDPESGKTACLASLYLLVSHAQLSGWSFSDSRSLMGFEDIARGARDWNSGNPPEQMTLRTELADGRSPGFLHLTVRRDSDGQIFEFALPDIPGEWTQELVSTARMDRLDFMQSADVIWIFLDGRRLSEPDKRNGQIVRLGQLAGRLKALLQSRFPKVILVPTHFDVAPLSSNVELRLVKEFERRGIEASIISVASFSLAPEITRAGFGLSELVTASVARTSHRPDYWPRQNTQHDRQYKAYGSKE